MTSQQKQNLIQAILAVPIGATIVFWLLTSAFVPRKEYETAMDRIERKMDCALFSLPTNCRQTMAPRMP